MSATKVQNSSINTSTTSSTTTTTRKMIRKSKLKLTSNLQMDIEETELQQEQLFPENVETTKMEQQKTKQKPNKNTKNKSTSTLTSTTSIENVLQPRQEEEKPHRQALTQLQQQEKQKQIQERQDQQVAEQQQQVHQISHETNTAELATNDAIVSLNNKKKLKSKKGKNNETNQQNISMNPKGEKEMNCRLCSKLVYKMEEIKAEKHIFHKHCFRCHECNKQLKVDNYQSHEGVLYCMVHFKLLLSPKSVQNDEPEPIRKPELIIRENQPKELPPDVVRASDKPDLGLQELQQLNVRSRFQVFENPSQMAKLQALDVSPDFNIKSLAAQHNTLNDSDEGNTDVHRDDKDDENEEADLVRSKKRTLREHPVGLGHAMNDIKTRFEKGHILSKEERREERKQEIQNIRSRLFMGKQARIKEMYQQAVAESANTSSRKKPDIETEGAARSLKERFEKGDFFKDMHADDDENVSGSLNGVGHRANGMLNEADVFESGISKNSRSIFMELDANQAATKTQLNRPFGKQHTTSSKQRQIRENESENVVKYDENPDDIKIETSEISSKFKFFETYRPIDQKRKEFRITPPREGVVKMPTPEESDVEPQMEQITDNKPQILEKLQTTSIILDKFRELATGKNHSGPAIWPRPLKCFTPPPDGGRRLYQEQDSDMGSLDDDDKEDDNDNENNADEYDGYRRCCTHFNDEALKEVQAAARAKQLRAKFEKWEVNERQREIGNINISSKQVSDDSNIESTKIIRERFENMRNLTQNQQPNRPRYQVNRFV